MSKIYVIIILLLQAGTSFAQNYFVFIGSDNRQPFYVRVDSQFHSSSAEGHLILSQLKDSTYNITIGFPGQTLPEQHYAFSIQGKDQAFELRPQDPGDLRLYDLQSNQWLSPRGGGVVGDTRSAGIKKDDAFSRMMAGVVRDTAVLYNTYTMERVLSDSPAAVAATPAAPASTAPVSTAAATTAAATPPVSVPTVTAARSTPPDTATTATSTMVITTSPSATPTKAITPPRPTTSTPDSTAGRPIDSIAGKTADSAIAATGNPATIPANPATARANPVVSASTTGLNTNISADTTATRPAGVIMHQPAARFNNSGATASVYRPVPKDSATTAAPIPSTVGAPLYRKVPGVIKVSERHTPKNVRLVYADRSGGKKADTIVVIIPIASPAIAKTAGHQPHADSSRIPAARAHGPNPNADSPAVSSVAYRATVPPTAPTEASRPHAADSSHKPGRTTAFINSDCHNFATDFDVDKLRVRMLQAIRDEDRIALARKTFRVKCFYTRQIRALSEVFTSDAAKFRFFEAAWPFAADDHFHELSSLLTDPVYNNKFKTMTHQQ